VKGAHGRAGNRLLLCISYDPGNASCGHALRMCVGDWQEGEDGKKREGLTAEPEIHRVFLQRKAETVSLF
jgi:hypothetical protein